MVVQIEDYVEIMGLSKLVDPGFESSFGAMLNWRSKQDICEIWGRGQDFILDRRK